MLGVVVTIFYMLQEDHGYGAGVASKILQNVEIYPQMYQCAQTEQLI